MQFPVSDVSGMCFCSDISYQQSLLAAKIRTGTINRIFWRNQRQSCFGFEKGVRLNL